MKTYPKMKDSGIEWIGEIPEEWKSEPLKFHASINQKILNEDTDLTLKISYIDIGSVHEGGIIDPPEILEYSEAPSRARRIITKNDTILSTVRTYLKAIAFVDEKNQNNICSTGFAVITPRKEITPKFLYHLLSSEKYIETIMANSYGVTYPAINSSIIGTFPCILPKPNEQKQIVDYLGKKISKIDSEISKNEKTLEFLKEKRQSIINHVITKGLDPTVPMKDSEIEWIGEIPEEWDVCALKFILKIPITDGPHITPEFLDEGIPFISAEAIKNSAINFNFAHYISQTNHDEYLKKAHPKKNDILLVKAGNTTGKVALVDVDFDFSIWSPLALIRVNQNNFPLFQFYCMYSRFFQDQINLTVNWNTQPNIGMNQIKNLMVIVPPLNEQKQISDFLNKQTSKIDSLFTVIESQIETLQEFRQSLISSAVTGKIDVRQEIVI